MPTATITGMRRGDVLRFASSTGRTTVTLTRTEAGTFEVAAQRGGKAVPELAGVRATEAAGRLLFHETASTATTEDQLVTALTDAGLLALLAQLTDGRPLQPADRCVA